MPEKTKDYASQLNTGAPAKPNNYDVLFMQVAEKNKNRIPGKSTVFGDLKPPKINYQRGISKARYAPPRQTEALQKEGDWKAATQGWRDTTFRNQFDAQGNFVTKVPGPNNEPLPMGAVGWDFNGEPYYGPGMMGFLNKARNRLYWPYDTPAPEDIWKVKQGMKTSYSRLMPGGTTTFTYPDLKAWQREVQPTDENRYRTAFGYMGKFLQEGIMLGLEALTAVDKQQKKPLGVVAQVADVGEPGYQVPEALQLGQTGGQLKDLRAINAQLTKEGALGQEETGNKLLPTLPTGDFAQLWQNYKEALPNIIYNNLYRTPGVLTYNLVKNFMTKDMEQLTEDAKTGWQSGKILYSSAVAPMLQAEYARRYQNGENPNMLAQELENPLAEGLGEAAFGITNLIGIGATAAKHADDIAKYAREGFEMAPEVEAAFDLGDTVSDITKLADIEGASRMDEVAGAVNLSRQRAAQGLDKYAGTRGLFTQTAEAKQHYAATVTGSWFGRVAADHPEPDMVADLLKAEYQMAHGAHTGNLDEIATGVNAAMHAKQPRIMFTKDAEMAGEVLYRMMGDDPGKFYQTITKLAKEGDISKVIEWAGERMSGAIEDILPTVDRMIQRGDDVSWSLKTVNKFHQASRKVYKPVNSFFSGIYMGLSPGYYFRNLNNNGFQIAIDQGFGALFNNSDEAINSVRNMLNVTDVPGYGGFGGGTGGIETAEILKKAGFTGLANKREKEDSARVIYAAVDRTMRQMVQPGRALPRMETLTRAGLSPESAQVLVDLVRQYDYDIPKAAMAFMDKIKTGDMWALDGLSILSKAEKEALAGMGTLNEASRVIDEVRQRGGSVDEAVLALREKYGKLDGLAERVAGDVPVVADDATGAQVAVDIGGAYQAEEVDEELYKLAAYYTTANSNAIGAHRQVIAQLLMDNETLAKIPPEARQKLMAYAIYDFPDVVKDNAKRRDLAVQIKEAINRKDFDASVWWAKTGLPGAAPESKEVFVNRIWDEYYFKYVREIWQDAREKYVTVGDSLYDQLQTAGVLDANAPQRLAQAKYQLDIANQWDNVAREDEVRRNLVAAINRGDNATAARIYAQQFKLDNANVDARILNSINAHLPEGATKYSNLRDVPPEVAREAFVKRIADQARERAGVVAPVAEEAAQVAPEAAKAAEAVIPYAGEAPQGFPRMLKETQPGRQKFLNSIYQKIRDNWDNYHPVMPSKDVEKAVMDWAKTAEKRVIEARTIAGNVGKAAREFTLLNYEDKRYFDLALSYVFPYHFWYNRTYAHWLQRLAQNPAVLANYGRYKDVLAKEHAGAPEWWKYNVNSNELLGLDSENPLFFNLEATLWPLHGLTGVDFEDADKRVGWWTGMLDDIGKLGPTLWTPLTMATALGLKMKGEEDAASRWGGRLIPQTALLKTLAAAGNLNIPLTQGTNEVDPSVWFFSNGMDPYERRRVGRALGWMIEEEGLDKADALEAAWTQKGPIWQEATRRALSQRAGGQLASTLFGVGFKARTASDMQIDMMDRERISLMRTRDNLSPEEYANGWDELRQKWPFMDTVLLSRKTGVERDTAYGYNVLGRIPPGQRDDIASLVGINYDFIQRFYDDKGRIEKWPETDHTRFMAAVNDIGAMLNLPDDATRVEWQQASKQYGQVMDSLSNRYGDDIQQRMDRYFFTRQNDPDAADALLEADPEIQYALDEKDRSVTQNPLLTQYYGGIDTVERYYKGLKFDAMRAELGDMDAIWNARDEAKLQGSKALKKWDKENKKWMDRYFELSDFYDKTTADAITRIAGNIKEPSYPAWRSDVAMESFGQQAIYNNQPERTAYDFSQTDWRGEFTDTQWRLLMDYYNGHEISYALEQQLDYIAEGLDVDTPVMLDLIEQSSPYTNVVPQLERGDPQPWMGQQAEPYDFESDNRLTPKAKEIIRRNVITFDKGEVEPSLQAHRNTTGLAFGLPETIARREESGFRRFGVGVSDPRNHVTYRHELAHTIDYVENISSNPRFIADAAKYAKEFDSNVRAEDLPEDWAAETFAGLFAVSMDDVRYVPEYMLHWFSPYLYAKRGTDKWKTGR